MIRRPPSPTRTHTLFPHPTLCRSRTAARDSHSAARAQARALTVSLAVTLPCAIGLVLLADPLMVGLFMRGAFDRVDAHGSAMALVAYGFGLPAFVLVRSLTPGFQARGDTQTPVKQIGRASVRERGCTYC